MPPSRDSRPPRRGAAAPKKAGGKKPYGAKESGGKKPYVGKGSTGAKKPYAGKGRAPRGPVEPNLADEAPKMWGSVARKATGRLREGGVSKASEAWRDAVDAGDRQDHADEWVRVDDVRGEATKAVRRGGRQAPARPARSTGTAPEPFQARRKTTPAVADELARVAGAMQAPKLGQRLAEATKAYERERYPEARVILKPLADRAPASAAVRELYGLTLYRLGQWRLAQRELEAFATLTGSTEQHPVLADCARALRQWSRVDDLWDELRTASPGAELVTEGRIVAAGALADRGKLREAIELLEQGSRSAKRLKEHHLRLLYALGDLRERAGEIPAARTLFRRVHDADPGFADVVDRLRGLG